MKVYYIAHYPQLQLGHKTLTKQIRSKQQSTQNQKTHTHTKTSLEHDTYNMNDSLQQHVCQPHTSNNSTHACTNEMEATRNFSHNLPDIIWKVESVEDYGRRQGYF